MAVETKTFRTSDELEELSWTVHDLFFDVDAIDYDSGGRRLRMQLAKTSKDLMNMRNYGPTLVVENVERLEIHDSEHVGYYDIYDVTYDAKARCIRIEGNITIHIRIYVGRCEIRLEGKL